MAHQKQNLKKILVINTGGTLCMEHTENGLQPVPGTLTNYLKKSGALHNKSLARELLLADQVFILPSDGRFPAVKYILNEYNRLIDSSNITFEDLRKIASDISRYYCEYDGFVIIHGTDTLHYTASMLTFMLRNLGKPVILTGSQLPIGNRLTDAYQNIAASLHAAATSDLKQVIVCFDNKLHSGVRVLKIDSGSFAGFQSPNYRTLVEYSPDLNVDINNNENNINNAEFYVNTGLEENIEMIYFYPGISINVISTAFEPPTKGVVLMTFGSGNIPSDRIDLLSKLKEAHERKILVVNCTQCLRGRVSDIYEAGAVLNRVGVIPGYDMTPSAALAKLAHVAALDCTYEEKRMLMMRNLVGELTPPPDVL